MRSGDDDDDDDLSRRDPSLLILDIPDSLQVALDVTADGRLPLPPLAPDSPSCIFNITIFLSSYETGHNLTITNGTAGAHNASLGNIMDQEPSSTVKHVNWVWPECLVGDGQPTGSGSARGAYNVSWKPSLAPSLVLFCLVLNHLCWVATSFSFW